jgi:hypothetical protein
MKIRISTTSSGNATAIMLEIPSAVVLGGSSHNAILLPAPPDGRPGDIDPSDLAAQLRDAASWIEETMAEESALQ